MASPESSVPPPVDVGVVRVPPPLDTGVAGASARREHEQRRARRRERTKTRYGSVIGAALDLKAPPQHEQAWATGATGEELVAKRLAERCSDDVVVLHDRRIPGSRANIDHIAICPTGVWIVDAKRYKGKVRVEKPLFGAAKLKIGGRDQTKLVAGVEKQIAVVAPIVAELQPALKVSGALCFVDADLPLLGLPSIRGVELTPTRRLAKRLSRPGPLSRDDVLVLATALAERLPAA